MIDLRSDTVNRPSAAMRRAMAAAAGLVVLDEERPRLAEDHAPAREMAEAFGRLSDVQQGIQ